MTVRHIFVIALALCFIACSCKKNVPATPEPENTYTKVSPDFDADSAYNYVDKQVAFGYRVPNTKEHEACGDYLASELKRHGAVVQEQKFVATAYDGTKLNARNIIGSYGLDKTQRVLLFAHWDTRPFSDHDPDPANYHKPLLGANDGASGVGVLLEMARVFNAKLPNIGIDIIFFDVEDYGTPAFAETKSSDGWCLGSQHWAKNPHVEKYKAKYGILFDMVGASDAVFSKEVQSVFFAGDVVEKVWATARDMGYGSYFVDQKGGAIMDDHIPVNEYRRGPSIDIIHTGKDYSFPTHWHTQKDDMTNIDKKTLKVVGQTVLEVIYKEAE